MTFPKHINLQIEHQPHACDYLTVDSWLAHAKEHDLCDVLSEDADEMRRTGEVWCLRWYPDTPVGWCCVAAASLERAIAVACAG